MTKGTNITGADDPVDRRRGSYLPCQYPEAV